MTYGTNATARGKTMRRFEITAMDRRPDGSQSEDTMVVGPFERELANSYADMVGGKMMAVPTASGTMRCWRVKMTDHNAAFGEEPVVDRYSQSGFLPLAEANAWFVEVFEGDKAVTGWGGGGS
jgi:hypothetical protein